MNLKKILIFDVDGTVCESCKAISDEMVYTLTNLKDSPTLVFISGSTVNQIYLQISPYLNVPHHLLGTSGAEYVFVQEGERVPVWNHQLKKDEKEAILVAFDSLVTKFNIKYLTTKEDQVQDRDSQITLSALGRHADPELKAEFDPFGNKRKEWVLFLQTILSKDKYDVKIGGTTSIDITRKGMDKGYGIKKFADHHGFKLKDMLFFGDKLKDGGNDFAVTKYVDSVEVMDIWDTIFKLKKM